MTDAQFKAVAKRSVEVDGKYMCSIGLRTSRFPATGRRQSRSVTGKGGRLQEVGEERRTVGLNKIEGTWKICN